MAKQAAERPSLMGTAGKKSKAGMPEKTANDYVEEGKRTQEQTARSLARSTKLVHDMEDMGAEAAVALRAQTEQIRATEHEVAPRTGSKRAFDTQVSVNGGSLLCSLCMGPDRRGCRLPQ